MGTCGWSNRKLAFMGNVHSRGSRLKDTNALKHCRSYVWVTLMWTTAGHRVEKISLVEGWSSMVLVSKLKPAACEQPTIPQQAFEQSHGLEFVFYSPLASDKVID